MRRKKPLQLVTAANAAASKNSPAGRARVKERPKPMSRVERLLLETIIRTLDELLLLREGREEAPFTDEERLLGRMLRRAFEDHDALVGEPQLCRNLEWLV